MKVLLVYPQFPDTFWSFRHALKFIGKKAAIPPLGLITVSAMFPDHWEKRLIDMNITSLRSSDIEWADYVFISAMYVQKPSVEWIISECRSHQVKIVAGGPLFTQEFNNYPGIDHFILNEAEITFPLFLKDLESEKEPGRIYSTEEYADLSQSPIPDFHLLSQKDYVSMNLQVSRGCPYSCDFCEITSLLGHKVRMKQPNQIINELEALFRQKWRGSISIVDDNFIGNKKEIKNNLLPAMSAWSQSHGHPFTFSIQSSINLADDEELMTSLVKTGISSAFIGIETPDEQALLASKKSQNRNRDLIQSVKKIQKSGMHVSGGFIVGFDSDTESIFSRQIEFIQKSGIVSAMVGLLNAPKNTRLYRRLATEHRLTIEPSGNNTDLTMNFIPKMDSSVLVEGFNNIIRDIYSVKPYYKRVRRFLLTYQKKHKSPLRFRMSHLKAIFRSIFVIGILHKGRTEFWKMLAWTLFNKPTSIIEVFTYAIYGYHFRTVYGLTKRN